MPFVNAPVFVSGEATKSFSAAWLPAIEPAKTSRAMKRFTVESYRPRALNAPRISLTILPNSCAWRWSFSTASASSMLLGP